MPPVTFVRTSPAALGEAPETGAVVCDACGTMSDVLQEPSGGFRNPLSLDNLFITHPSATFFVQVGTHDVPVMESTYLGVRTGDMLVVDRSLAPRVGSLVLAVRDNELTLCRYTEHEGRRFLVCGSRQSAPVEIVPEGRVSVWGVVAALHRRM